MAARRASLLCSTITRQRANSRCACRDHRKRNAPIQPQVPREKSLIHWVEFPFPHLYGLEAVGAVLERLCLKRNALSPWRCFARPCLAPRLSLRRRQAKTVLHLRVFIWASIIASRRRYRFSTKSSAIKESPAREWVPRQQHHGQFHRPRDRPRGRHHSRGRRHRRRGKKALGGGDRLIVADLEAKDLLAVASLPGQKSLLFSMRARATMRSVSRTAARMSFTSRRATRCARMP